MVVVSVEHCSVARLAIRLDTEMRQKPCCLSDRPTPSVVCWHDGNTRLRTDVTAESPELTLDAANGNFNLPVTVAAVTWGGPASRRLRSLAGNSIGECHDSWFTIRLDTQRLMS